MTRKSRTRLAAWLGVGYLSLTTAQTQQLSPSLTGLSAPAGAIAPSVVAKPSASGGTSATGASGDVTATMTGTARDTRWDASFAAFDAEDKKGKVTPGGVVFVGSSSIRLWTDLQQDFHTMPVIYKRGFGGSRMLDCANHLQRLVIPYKPKLVGVYAGDNDLAEGRTPDEVLDSFTRFVEGVRQYWAGTPKNSVSVACNAVAAYSVACNITGTFT